jgi:hypothetical protein
MGRVDKGGITSVLIVAVCLVAIGCAEPDVPYCSKEEIIELAESQLDLRYSAFPVRIIEGASTASYDGAHVWTVYIEVEALKPGPSGPERTGEYWFIGFKVREPESCKQEELP